MPIIAVKSDIFFKKGRLNHSKKLLGGKPVTQKTLQQLPISFE